MKMNFKMFSYSVVLCQFTTLAKDSRHTGNLFGENIGGLPSAILKYIRVKAISGGLLLNLKEGLLTNEL